MKIIETGTLEDIKNALQDPKIEVLITSGHGNKYGSIETSDNSSFSPYDLQYINVSSSLKTVIFQNCYQGGSDKDPNDNELFWENAFGNNVDVVGWRGETTKEETVRFNGAGLFDRQPKNLLDYLRPIVESKK